MADEDDALRIGTPNVVTGDYPRTLWTVADGEQMSTGTEEIEPGSEIPWHAHPDAEEVLVCIKGAGTILTDGDSYDFAPGVPFHVKRTVQHRIVNDSASEKLWLTWTLSPPQSVATFTKQARGHGAQALSTDTDEGGGSEALSPTEALAALGIDGSTLSDAEKKQLDEQGFLPVEGVVGEAHLKAMKEACEEMLAYNAVDGQEYGDSYDEHEGKALTVANLQNKSTLFDICFTHPKVVAAISYVLGREFEGAEWEGMKSAGIHTRANEPGWGANNFGQQQSLHTDGSTEADHPHYVVCNSMWMLDDFTLENGATRLVPASHRFGAGAKPPEGHASDPRELSLIYPAGTVVVFNSHCWHGAGLNNSSGRRDNLTGFWMRRSHSEQYRENDPSFCWGMVDTPTFERLGAAARTLFEHQPETERGRKVVVPHPPIGQSDSAARL